MLKGFASDTSSSHCWLACLLGWRVGSLCSTRITGLPRSYGPIRPCASHRYSAPHGSATWSSPLASRRQVPTFRTRASRWPHAVFMPVTTRTVGRHPPSFFPGQQLEPGFGDVPTLSTRHQRFTCVRLASAHLTGSPRLFRNAHHLGHWTKAACGGLDPDPAIRARGTCPHLLCSKAASSWLSLLHGSLLFAPSWRTVIGEPLATAAKETVAVQDQRLTFVRDGFCDLGCIGDVQRKCRARLCRNRSRARNMTDGVFFVRSGVEDDRAGLRQRHSQLRGAHLGTDCDTAEDPIENARRLTPRCRWLRLHLRRSRYRTHHHHSNDQYDPSLSRCRH